MLILKSLHWQRFAGGLVIGQRAMRIERARAQVLHSARTLALFFAVDKGLRAGPILPG